MCGQQTGRQTHTHSTTTQRHTLAQDEHKHWRGELNGARVGERNQPIGHVDADGGDATEDGTQGDVESMASDAEEGQAVDGDGREVKDYLKY